MTTQETKNQDFNTYIKWFWKLFFLAILLIILFFLLASWGVFGKLPDHTVLENPKTNLATEIISSDGKTLGKFYFDDNRTPVKYTELPQNLIDALVATEDARFYSHSGIDARGTIRAAIKLGTGGGASTISQQLAKQLFHGEGSRNLLSRIAQKAKEWIIAIKLERQYTKEEIITQYLNIYDFNYQADGIRSAASIYFNKEPKELNMQEAAMLVGMLKNSSLYNPLRREEMVLNRRNVVLSQMEKYGYISEAVKDSVQQLPLEVKFTPQSHRDGVATYFRAYLQGFMKDWVKQKANYKPDGTPYDIYRDGLKIYTTIDSRMQNYAEKAVAQHMPRLQAEFFHQNTPDRNPTAPFLELEEKEIDELMQRSIKQSERWRHLKYDLKKSNKEIIASFDKPTEMTVFEWKDGLASEKDTVMTPMDSMRYYKSFLRTGMMSLDPQKGHVKAWVGGINYKHFQYDHVMQAKRQVGSTFKPFVYATAMDQLHLSPCDELPNTQITIEANKYGNPEPWTPKNSDEKYGGTRTLKNALANSINTITARLMDKVGPKPVVDLVKRLGVTSEIPVVPSIALGTPDISVYEMVGAYAAFANKGVYIKPVMLTHIEDKNGTILYQVTPESRDALSEEAAYVTTNLMKGVTQSGSGSRLRHNWAKNRSDYKEVVTGYPYEFTNPIAGKTGTTQNQSDGWFMGMVPNLVTGVWVGAEDRAAHFKSLRYGQGASMALPIWALYMKSCYANEELKVSDKDFKRPSNLSVVVDCENYTPQEENENGTENPELPDEEVPDELEF